MRVESLENLRAAEQHLKQAVELDPGHGWAHAVLAWLYYATIIFGREWHSHFGFLLAADVVTRARGLIAISLRNPTAYAYGFAGLMHRYNLKPEAAFAAFEQALRLNPNDADALIYLADALNWAGRPGEGLAHTTRAFRLNPKALAAYRKVLGQLRFATEDYEGADDALVSAVRNEPDDWFSHYYLVAALGHLGRMQEAKAAIRHYDEEVVPVHWRASEGPLTSSWVAARPITMWAPGVEYSKELSVRQKRQIFEGLKRAGLK